MTTNAWVPAGDDGRPRQLFGYATPQPGLSDWYRRRRPTPDGVVYNAGGRDLLPAFQHE
jgi:hypothetical protein